MTRAGLQDKHRACSALNYPQGAPSLLQSYRLSFCAAIQALSDLFSIMPSLDPAGHCFNSPPSASDLQQSLQHRQPPVRSRFWRRPCPARRSWWLPQAQRAAGPAQCDGIECPSCQPSLGETVAYSPVPCELQTKQQTEREREWENETERGQTLSVFGFFTKTYIAKGLAAY